ncbi:bridging integrator 2a [Dunckerocampus dactyliophorus]|uniref:bridging integrator 2a n=1 Tax=Dunckerocampus dactyliophorus TaxID=161453 RepID=UPI0024077189|nr:bridging integrator 2a [Dunckerocampus dactyliophorus]
MADHSLKGGSGDFAKKVQRQLSRSKEKVLQKLGKSAETRDDHFERYLQQFYDQQTDGNRIYKDLRNYIEAVRDMRIASRRLSQSFFDVYESNWVGEEDIGAIVEGEDLLWNDYEVKLLDQAVRTMETYVGQFPDVREKVAKRGRKLVDYDSSRHHLKDLQTSKKKDDVKISKAEDEMCGAKRVYERINSELKDELPALHESRIGCYVAVFSAISNLRDIFYKEMRTLNLDLNNVVKELQAQHPDNVFAVKGLQRYGSLKRHTLLSPKAWKTSFSEFHRSYSPKGGQRFSFRSPEKPRHSSLSRESSTIAVSPLTPPLESPTFESRGSSRNAMHVPAVQEGAVVEAASQEEANQEEEGEASNAEEAKKKPEDAAETDSSCELNNSCDSESLELQLMAGDETPPLRIDESDLSHEAFKVNGLENGDVSTELDADSRKDVPADPKSTEV